MAHKTPTDNELRTLATEFPISFHEFRNVGVAHGMDADALRIVARYAATNNVDLHVAAADGLGTKTHGQFSRGRNCLVTAGGVMERADAELHKVTLLRILECCGTWEYNACVIGDVRAGDAVTALMWALSGTRPMPAQPDTVAELRAEVARLNRRIAEVAHRANEWADAATNGPCWLKNVRDGICTFDDAINSVESDIRRCRASAVTEAAPMPADTEQDETLAKLIDLLTRTANAVKGQPGEMKQHGWADLPELCAALTARVAELKDALLGLYEATAADGAHIPDPQYAHVARAAAVLSKGGAL